MSEDYPVFSDKDFNVFEGLIARLDQDGNTLTMVWRDVDTGEEVIRAIAYFSGKDVVWTSFSVFKSWQRQGFLTTLTAEIPKIFRSEGFERFIVPEFGDFRDEIFEKVGYEHSGLDHDWPNRMVGNIAPQGKLVRTSKARLKQE